MKKGIMKVAILMLTHNAPLYVLKSIWTVRKRTAKSIPYELIVVDNRSKFATRILCRLLRVLRFVDKLKLNETNRLFAAGNNVASELAAEDVTHYLLLNSDIEVRDSKWLEVLSGLARESDIAAFGAIRAFPQRADGYCMMVKRELYDKYRLDEQFAWWWSVTKFESEILKAGGRICAVDDHEKYLHHFGGKSNIDLSKNAVAGMNTTVETVAQWFSSCLGQVVIVDKA